VSVPLPDLSTLLTSSIRIIEKERSRHLEPVEQLSEDKMPRKQWIHCNFETHKQANTGSRDSMDVDGKVLDEITLNAFYFEQ
jgi:hypothetical protein